MNHDDEFPILVAQDGPLKGERWPLSHTLMIGRDPTCDISIQDRQVSRFHARITPSPEGVMVEDLGSKNGTIHNGAEVAGPVILQDGDLLGIALAQQFLFLTSDATMPLVEGAIRNGRLMMDQKSRRVWVNQQQVNPPLSAQQFKLLWMLYENNGQVIGRADLVSNVWGEEQMAGVSDQALDALIRRLRDRLASLDLRINTLTQCVVMACGWITQPPGNRQHGRSFRKTTCTYYSRNTHCCFKYIAR